MIKSTRFYSIGAVLTVLAISSTIVSCRSISGLENSKELKQQEDPMLALPSEQYLYAQGNQQQPETQQLHYFVQAQPEQQVVQYVQYEQPGHQVVLVRQNHHPSFKAEAEECDKKHEYAALSGLTDQPEQHETREYPGQVVYISEPNDDAANSIRAATSELTSDQYYANGLPKLVESISESRGLPATILTEVPVRDMPPSGKSI